MTAVRQILQLSEPRTTWRRTRIGYQRVVLLHALSLAF